MGAIDELTSAQIERKALRIHFKILYSLFRGLLTLLSYKNCVLQSPQIENKLSLIPDTKKQMVFGVWNPWWSTKPKSLTYLLRNYAVTCFLNSNNDGLYSGSFLPFTESYMFTFYFSSYVSFIWFHLVSLHVDWSIFVISKCFI